MWFVILFISKMIQHVHAKWEGLAHFMYDMIKGEETTKTTFLITLQTSLRL